MLSSDVEDFLKERIELFTKMAPKAKTEAPAPPKAEAKAKALKAKKAVLASTATKKRRPARHPRSGGLRHGGSVGSLNILGRAPPGETS